MAVTAAALAVCVLPTACDYPLASPPGAPTAPIGGTPGEATTAPVVVPVANATDASAQRVRDRERRDRDRTRTRTPRPTKPPVTTSPPVVTDPTSTSPTATSVTDTSTTTATTAPPAPGEVPVVPPGGKDGNNNGIADVLGRDCTTSKLDIHNGFQDDPAGKGTCVTTAMGEVAPQDRLPSLLITGAPPGVAVGAGFQLQVSTRNLVRDRFLGAAAGGYYLESSFLNDKQLQRGHFHTACRMLASTDVAPDSSAAPAFFVATQDNKGGSTPDTVSIDVPASATAKAGVMQCTSWAGDGSHRTPMMTRANQTPAIDSVRITIGGEAQPVQNIDNAAAAQADAQADAQQQAAAEQAEAGQAPDQDGATQLEGEQTAPAAPASDTEAPASADDSDAPASSSDTAAPASSKSLDERFQELRESRDGGEG